jgi:serine protease Do
MKIRVALPLMLVLAFLLALAPRPTRAAAAATAAAMTPQDLRKLYERVTPSLVAVQFIWENELGRRELVGSGIVVGEDGLILTSMQMFDLRMPDAQMKEFKIIVPSQTADHEEIDAVFQGRDERTQTAFVRPKSTSDRKWTPLKFDEDKVGPGDLIASIGLLPKNGGYKTYLTRGSVSANLRGEIPQVLVVGGGLAGIGSPVFNADGKAIGYVNNQPEHSPYLNSDFRASLVPLLSPPLFFVPTYDLTQSLKSPPKAGEQMKLPWLGVPQQAMAGLNKDVAESVGLKDQPAIELGDILKNSPAEKAGLKPGDIIVKLNGQPLERGDEPEELPMIFSRKIRRMNVGDTVTLSILDAKDKPLKEVKVELSERPRGSNLAERFYAEDLGFGVREIVFMDTYVRKLQPDARGVVVAVIKPQSSAAAAKLQGNDLITEMNGEPVENIEQFKKSLEAIRKDKPREALVLVVLRDGTTQTIRIEPPQ